ncbi:hypothetical protein DXG03_003175 [Asterophora parasitica]|uniref:Uncharacterized protein n=1 Tax=Asterophora parasitica TaxID=117018 RepID=A0A9P7GDI6_9AGAR|nr:hypothetical protein DXG03_003175 [Asterophora parasitica]
MAYKDSVGHVHQEAGILNKGNALETDGAVLAAPTREEASPECTSTPMSPVDEPQSHETTSSESSITPIISTTTPERHLAALTSQNILLRHRVDTLESLLSCVRRELGTVKRALGPWAMAKEQGQGLASRDTGSYFSTELPLSAQPASASTSTGPVNAEGAAPPTHLQPVETFNLSPQAPYPHPWQYGNGSTAPPHMPPTDSLARYFPAEVEDISLSARQRQAVRAHHASSSVEFPGPHPRQGYEMFTSANNVANAHLHLPPPPPLVAPLNLGTTLEGTLHGLRESVVGLAVSVDSLGRRQEIALTNETTRMAEEVGGLRAGLHGLRMQVRV